MIEAFINRGVSKHKLGDGHGAIEDYNTALKIDKDNENVLLKRMISYGALAKFDLAILDANRVLELNPNNAAAYFFRGLAQQDLGIEIESELNIRKAAELGFEEAIDMLNHLNN